MKKYLSLLSVVFLLMFLFNGLAYSQDVDPQGKLDEILRIQNQNNAAILDVLKDVQYDYHPVYGNVSLRDYPVNENGWNEGLVPSLFPGQNIVSYKVTEERISGYALVEHKADDGTRFWVWHQVENEPAVCITASVENPVPASSVDKNMAMATHYIIVRVIYKCVNGYTLVEYQGCLYWVDSRLLRPIFF